ncbi:hypothetical protein ACWGQ2_01110 [Arthrobacter sp. NPDC055585]
MNLLYSLTLTVTNPIEGDLKPGLEEGDITPGLLGFLATLFLALCVVFLIRDMVKRIRRVRYRSQITGEGGGTEAEGPAGDEAAEDAALDAAENTDHADPRPSSSNPAG